MSSSPSSPSSPSSASSPDSTHAHAAYIEECDDDDEEHVPIPGTRQTANVAAKRSRPDIRQVKSTTAKGRDAASDSGYSSQTVGTVGSTDSYPREPKQARPPSRPQLSRTPSNRMSMPGEFPDENGQRSPEASMPHRSVSRAQRRENLRLNLGDTRDGAAKMRLGGPPAERPTSATPNQSHHPSRPRHGPPSPQAVRTAPQVLQGPLPIPMPRQTQVRPRAFSSQTYNVQRPQSFHGAAMPEHVFAPQAAPMYIEQRRQQQPPMYVNTNYGQQAYSQPSATFLPTPLQNSPQRQPAYHFPPTQFPGYYQPPQQQWPGDPYRRRGSMQAGPPVVDYPMVPGYTTTPYPPPPQQITRRYSTQRTDRPLMAERPPMTPMTPTEEPMFFEDQDEEFYRMPPPPKPTNLPARPVMRHAHTTSVTHPPAFYRRAERDSMERSYEVSPRKQSFEVRKQSLDGGRPPSRPSMDGGRPPSRPSMDGGRPPSRPSMPARTSNYSSSSNNGVHTYSNNGVQTYIQHSGPPTPQRHRPRPPSYLSQDPVDLERQVEEYQTAKSGASRPLPLTVDAINQVVKRRSKIQPSNASETGSRGGSSRDGSEVKHSKSMARESMERPKTNGSEVKSRKPDGPEDRFTMRILTGQGPGVTLGFKSDGMEGKTISLRPSRDGGNMELSIGDRAARTRESHLRESSVKRYSSVTDRKPPVREIGEREYHNRREQSRSVMYREDEAPKEITAREAPSEREIPRQITPRQITPRQRELELHEERGDSMIRDKGLIKKFKNLRTSDSRSRKGSRNGRGVVLDGEMF